MTAPPVSEEPKLETVQAQSNWLRQRAAMLSDNRYEPAHTFGEIADTLDAMLVRLRSGSLAQEGGWKDIGTAPKDGSVIDVWCGDWDVPRRLTNVVWFEGAFFRQADKGLPRDDRARILAATHWMHPPAAPTPPTDGEES